MCDAPMSCTLAMVWTQNGGDWTGTDLINSVLGDVKLKFELDGENF